MKRARTGTAPGALRRQRRTCGLALLVWQTFAAQGCIDLGYRLPGGGDSAVGQEDAGPSADGSAGPCTEGSADPSESGPQLRFVPTNNVDQRELVIQTGDVVTWTNTDNAMHTATAGAPGAILPPERLGFDSGRLPTGRQWAYRFCTPRTVVWFCQTHPAMMNGYRIVISE